MKLPDWTGETVAIFAGGPSMNQRDAESVRHFKTVAVNYSFRLAPWANMLMAMDSDAGFWEEAKDFTGIKVCGGSYRRDDAICIGHRFERVVLGPLHTIEIRNSGLTALRMVGEFGAKKIITLGYDHDALGQHHAGYAADYQSSPDEYPHLPESFTMIVAELRAKGVEVERYRG